MKLSGLRFCPAPRMCNLTLPADFLMDDLASNRKIIFLTEWMILQRGA
ncbi:hypothetical protein FHW71_000431 [Enterobacter sp. Sphag1F]|nr:hypothetical protein [Enterobacter sp. Sphag1F]NYI12967.1 hypothetical protein [Enterobacter sp. Sphag71]